MKKYFPYVVLISALSLAGCAAYYSVYGLSRLFSAQATAVIIMASILEAAKLITATYLHRYWKKLNILLKSYLTIAVIILMAITSLGIYGFLTSAYQTTSDELMVLDKQINVVEMKKERFQDQLDSYSEEIEIRISDTSITSFALSNDVNNFADEGDEVEFTLTTSAASGSYSYSLLGNEGSYIGSSSGTPLSVDDFVSGTGLTTSLTGTFTGNGDTVKYKLKEDNLTEGTLTMALVLDDVSYQSLTGTKSSVSLGFFSAKLLVQNLFQGP